MWSLSFKFSAYNKTSTWVLNWVVYQGTGQFSPGLCPGRPWCSYTTGAYARSPLSLSLSLSLSRTCSSTLLLPNVSHTMCTVKNFTADNMPLFYIDAFTSSKDSIDFTIKVEPVMDFQLQWGQLLAITGINQGVFHRGVFVMQWTPRTIYIAISLSILSLNL